MLNISDKLLKPVQTLINNSVSACRGRDRHFSINYLFLAFFKKFFLIVFFLYVLLIPIKALSSDSTCNVIDESYCSTESSDESDLINSHENCDKIIYLFYSKYCPHCSLEREFINKLLIKYPQIQYQELEIHKDDNEELLKQKLLNVGEIYRGVPVTIIGGAVVTGYSSDELTGSKIKNLIFDLYCIGEEESREQIVLPFWGRIDINKLSLPALTIALGVIDGFNPCAMWALIALVTILIATRDKRKIRLVGGIFIISSWLIYYLFISLYLNAFILLSFTTVIRYIIGAVALIAGGYYIKSFIAYRAGVCKVTSGKQQKSILERMKKVVAAKSTWLIIAGVIALAFSVNLIEMVCSIGLPVIYTQILVLSGLSKLQYYLYLALYNTLYMADDIVVVIIAATTLKYVNLNNKYERAMKLIGGVLIIVLGLILIFRPDLLTF